ncbi:hypothetical protein Hs30E_00410 [Lactococcus hodotermopsidis]|uniref:Type II toxin-antitoxin system RelE/ParE family toxin n=2 Tax=Pseudolactococcus hodotermopsidis TaxID=2709157 RepID=A0A6A0B819_9LACT|nr:hypothetical protein Hs30E_00410 [Lactococcus hodotermopsidis]
MRMLVTDSFYEDYNGIIKFLIENNATQKYIAKVESEIKQALDSIEESPYGNPKIEDTPFRKKIRFKYITLYVIYDEFVRVARVFHEKEDWINELD